MEEEEYRRLTDYRQLYRPPAASLQVLDSASKGLLSTDYPPEQLVAADSPRNFVRHILRERYFPPTETPFVPFASEEGRYDVVRARYLVDSRTVEIASTLCVLSISVSMQADVSCLARATRLLQEMFITKAPILLIQVGQQGDMSYGKQGRPRSTEYPFWEDNLRWWCTPTQVGFLTLATLGAPTRLAYNFDPEINRHWFRFHRRTRPPRSRTEE